MSRVRIVCLQTDEGANEPGSLEPPAATSSATSEGGPLHTLGARGAGTSRLAQQGPSTYRFRLSIDLGELDACLLFPLVLLLGQQGLAATPAVLQGGEPET